MGLWWGKCFDHWLVCDSVHCGGLCSIPLRDDAGTGMGQRGDLPRRIPLRTDLEHAQPRHRETQTAIAAQGSQTTGDDVISIKKTWRSRDDRVIIIFPLSVWQLLDVVISVCWGWVQVTWRCLTFSRVSTEESSENLKVTTFPFSLLFTSFPVTVRNGIYILGAQTQVLGFSKRISWRQKNVTCHWFFKNSECLRMWMWLSALREFWKGENYTF